MAYALETLSKSDPALVPSPEEGLQSGDAVPRNSSRCRCPPPHPPTPSRSEPGVGDRGCVGLTWSSWGVRLTWAGTQCCLRRAGALCHAWAVSVGKARIAVQFWLGSILVL